MYVAAVLSLFPRVGSADDGCLGLFSIVRPLPDRCLEPIDTDRPHLTESPHVVAPGHVQVESGVVGFSLRTNRRARLALFENLYKVGIVNRLDLELLVVHVDAEARSFALVRPTPLVGRAKIALHQTATMEATLVPIVVVPLDEGDVFELGTQVFFGWALPRGLDLEVNAGLQIPLEQPADPTFIVGSALTTNVIGPLRAFGELYGIHSVVARPQLTLGAGLVLAVSRDVQLDTGLFVGLVGDTRPIVPFLGASFRI
jgi:hypothetical protein